MVYVIKFFLPGACYQFKKGLDFNQSWLILSKKNIPYDFIVFYFENNNNNI